jgi:hypothetical protein
MANPLDVLPDDLVAVREYLTGIAKLTALTSATHFVSEIPQAPDFSTPYVILKRAGGRYIWPAIDESAVQIDVLGGAGKIACSLVARTVRAAMWAIANDIVAAGVLSSCNEEMAPSWSPDTVSKPTVPRYVARYLVRIHN